ncbi:MAG TPA: SIR2 family protein [Chloroflexia bacterium]|jgi:hypothetical protein
MDWLRSPERDLETLKELIASRRLIPFIGAGFSIPLGLPSWEGLIDHVADELNYDADVFKSEGNYLQLAEYYILVRGRIGELRSYLDRSMNSSSIEIENSKAHMLLVELNAPIIYTTNYDDWIERSHQVCGKRYHSIVTIDDMVRAEPDVIQIVKFHGSLTLDDSLVIAESHYFDRLSFTSALDIKLRNDMLGRSLMFLGYSFEDINLRYMWYQLMKLWQQTGHSSASMPLSYFVGFGMGEIQKLILKRRYNIVCIELDPGSRTESIIRFLEYLLS